MDTKNSQEPRIECEMNIDMKHLVNEYKMALFIGNLRRQHEWKQALQDLSRIQIEQLIERGRKNVKNAVDSMGHKRSA